MWEAAIAAGATLEEIDKIDRGEFSPRFIAKLLAWHTAHRLVGSHTEDAVAKAAKAQAKKK